MCLEAMLFSILGEILVQLGCQDEAKMSKKSLLNLYEFLNEILMDFGSPGAAFRAGCQGRPNVGNNPGASRAR